jgi:hypothetical protein
LSGAGLLADYHERYSRSTLTLGRLLGVGWREGLSMTERITTNANAAGRLLELIQMRLISEAIHVVAALGVADMLSSGPKSAAQIAEQSQTSASFLRRVMRALTGFGVFTEDSQGCFELAPLGEYLRRDAPGSLHAAARFFGGDAGTNVIHLFLDCVKTGQSAIPKLAGDKGLFEWLQKDSERTQLFNAVMTSFSTLHMTGVLEAYDFSWASKIVDVGGGHGKILSEILLRNPRLRGILFDLQHAHEGGQRTMAQAGVADRCQVLSGDFFNSVPDGADAYVLSRVIHDWDDATTVAILKIVRAAIAPRGRLILLETMLRPSAGTVYPLLSDLNMLLMTGGCERTEDEYRTLYRASGFELTQAIPTASPTGTTVIEGRPI